MIVFDGVSIDRIAGVMIEDVYISPIEIAPTVRERAITAGDYFVRNRFGTRTVTMNFALLSSNVADRQASLMAVSAWAKSDKEYKLEIYGHPNHYLMAVCTSKPSPSLRQWWEAGLQIVFTCYENPFWNAISEKGASCGTQFNVLGDAPPLMRIERTLASSASNQSYSLDGRTITFSTLSAGDLVIDLNKQTAVVGSTSMMQYYNVNSRFLIPRTGVQTISGTGSIVYRERWQ